MFEQPQDGESEHVKQRKHAEFGRACRKRFGRRRLTRGQRRV